MATTFDICTIDDIPANRARGFTIELNDETFDFFIVRKDDSIYGYINSCPHTGVNLEWMPDKFLDLSGSVIQCSTHGAQFRIENGFCIYGPCLGRYLERVELEVRDNNIKLIL